MGVLMRLGINAGFGEPVQHEFAFLSDLGFQLVRQDLFAKGDSSPVESLVGEFANQQLTPLFLIAGGKISINDGTRRIEPHELAARARRLVSAAGAAGLTSYLVEIGNEPDIAHEGYSQHPSDFGEALRQSHEALRLAGFTGPIISGGVANLDDRGIGYLRSMLSTGVVPDDVVIGFHRYPVTAKGPEAPERGSSSRDNEWRALKQVTGTRVLACTEFGYHTAPDRVLGIFKTHRTDQEAADGVMFDIRYFQERGVELAALFQINDGPDPNNFEHHFGIRRLDGTLKPVAIAIRQASRTDLGTR
jgi:hypothetical protein